MTSMILHSALGICYNSFMSLTKNDLKQIDQVVGKRVKQEVGSAKEEINKNVDKKIGSVKEEIIKNVDRKIGSAKEEIIGVLSREIADLAKINRAVIDKVDKIDELEKRIIQLEERAGIRVG